MRNNLSLSLSGLVCRANCKSCQDSYNCDVCESDFYLIKDVFSKCLLSCPAGFLAAYSLESGNVCNKGKRGIGYYRDGPLYLKA